LDSGYTAISIFHDNIFISLPRNICGDTALLSPLTRLAHVTAQYAPFFSDNINFYIFILYSCFVLFCIRLLCNYIYVPISNTTSTPAPRSSTTGTMPPSDRPSLFSLTTTERATRNERLLKMLVYL